MWGVDYITRKRRIISSRYGCLDDYCEFCRYGGMPWPIWVLQHNCRIFFFGIYFLWVLNVVPFTSKSMHNVVAHLVSSLPHWIVPFFILWLQYVGNSVTAVPCHITIWHSLTQTHIHAHGSASAGAILPLTMTTHPITNNRVTNQKIFTLMHTTFAGKRDTYARNTHTHTQRSDLMHFVLRGICLHMGWMVKQWTRH